MHIRQRLPPDGIRHRPFLKFLEDFLNEIFVE